MTLESTSLVDADSGSVIGEKRRGLRVEDLCLCLCLAPSKTTERGGSYFGRLNDNDIAQFRFW